MGKHRLSQQFTDIANAIVGGYPHATMTHGYKHARVESWRLDLTGRGDTMLEMNAGASPIDWADGDLIHRVWWEGAPALVDAYERERLSENRPGCLVFQPFPSSAHLACSLNVGMDVGPRFSYDHAFRQLDELRRLLQLPPGAAEAARLWGPRDGFSRVATVLVDHYKHMILTHVLGDRQESWHLSDPALNMHIQFKDVPAVLADVEGARQMEARPTTNYQVEWAGNREVAEMYLAVTPSLVRLPFVIGGRAARFELTLTRETIMSAPRAFFAELQTKLVLLLQCAVHHYDVHGAFPGGL